MWWLTASMGLLLVLLFWGLMVIAEDQLERISLHQWLDAEATQYERNWQLYGTSGRLPNPYAFDFYQQEQAPQWLSTYQQSGFYEHQLGPEDKHFLVQHHPSGAGLYYLVFKDNADDFLDPFEEQLHHGALLMGLLMSILLMLCGYYLVRTLRQPLQELLTRIPQLAPGQAASVVSARFQELAQIEQQLLASKQQIEGYFRREQEFNRFASHEIRTPLMVLQGSAELLAQIPAVQAQPLAQRAIQRIEQSCSDIRLLTEVFLLLGQERIDTHHIQPVDIGQRLNNLIPSLQTLFNSSGLAVHQNVNETAVVISAPPGFVDVLLTNLLKNAFIHGHQHIQIELSRQTLTICNGVSPDSHPTPGYGYGLQISARICERLGWSLDDDQDDHEFRIIVRWPEQPAH
ncbi:sensor histidine kinase [Parathalassolituus penaei]|uniref:histidine kinase n=1 Tax=Parathalassolituus penaei TaxID=2997323 RepID=A0A9X3EFF9_9GAMM|nr:HAMP domain-containing sensor histidine kinase [Parathalassolituus penaei]MCY0966270.1 HAMP domain-containing sensor histidine kinase [Parathalassolituus penaei]